MRALTQITVHKMKYPADYKFSNEGELELQFIDTRKEMRGLFDQLCKLVCSCCMLNEWTYLYRTSIWC